VIIHAICLAAMAVAQPPPEAAAPPPPAQFQLDSPAAEPSPPEVSPNLAPDPAPEEPASGSADTPVDTQVDTPPDTIPERFGPELPRTLAPPPPVEAPVESPADPSGEVPRFPCDRLDYLWSGPYAGEPGAEGAEDERPGSREEAAAVYAEYMRYLFLSEGNPPTCEIGHDPVITLANACAAVARGRGSVTELARTVGQSPESVNAVWLMDAIIRHDRQYAGVWRNYFGPGPAFRIIGMLFDELPRGGAPVYQALLGLTESSQGVYADYIARRFIDLFVNRPQWVLLNAERLFPFGPALRTAFCTYLSIPEREALVLRYGEFPYSNAQAAVIELIACL